MKAISWLLILLGCLFLISLFSENMESREDYFYMFSFALSFLVLGALGLEYVRQKYRGGAQTIIGTIFCLLGSQFTVLSLEQYFRGLNAELVRGGAVAALVFLATGIILIRNGYKEHNKANAHGQN